MQIKVTGNIRYFKDHPNQVNWWEYKALSIFGPFGTNYHISPYTFLYDKTSFLFNWYDLRKLADKIRGCDFKELFQIFDEYKIIYPVPNNYTYQEVGLVKALFNTLIWLEIDLIELNKVSLESHIFNEFILDYSAKKSTQEDIYFIPKEISTDISNEKYFAIMSVLNLICTLEITFPDGSNIKSYFLPFYKIGVTHLDFTFLSPIDGPRSFLLYRHLLGYRDSKIKDFINKK